MSGDGYAATAGAFDLHTAPGRAARLHALERLVPLMRPDHGPVLDVGAGSGADAATLLERVPAVEVLALEPSPAMRSLVLSRLAARPDWFPRVTVRPEPFFDAPLPLGLGGAVLLGVLGHFDAGERAAVLAELGDRLAPGSGALLDLQAPERPAPVPAQEHTTATIGALSYRYVAEAWPLEGDRMCWRLTYLTLDGDRVLVEETAEHDFHHPDPERVRAEAEAVGLGLTRVDDTTCWLLTRR